MTNHGDKYAAISAEGFKLFRMDFDTLRSKYQRIAFDIPRTMVRAMKRKHLVEGLLVEKFGKEAIQDYNDACKVWNEMEKSAWTGK